MPSAALWGAAFGDGLRNEWQARPPGFEIQDVFAVGVRTRRAGIGAIQTS